jgi:cell shape-determining protein MreD
MRYVMLGIVALLFVALQTALFLIDVPLWLVPQCLVCIVVFLAFYECSFAAALGAFCLGLLLDIASGVSVGPWAGAYVFVFGFFLLLSQRLFIESRIVLVVATGAAAVMATLLCSLLALEASSVGLGQLLGQGMATALSALVVFPTLQRFWRQGVTDGQRWSASVM